MFPGRVHQDAQHAEKLRHGLDFVDDHETLQRAKHQLWILEAIQIQLGFEVKKSSALPFRIHPGERRFPTLPGTNESRDRGASDRAG